jgi:hypothetical protein
MPRLRPSLPHCLALAAALWLGPVGRVGAQGAPVGPRTAETLAVLDVLFVGELANAIQPADSLVAPEASVKLRGNFAAAPGVTVVDSARLAAALASSSVAAAAGGKPCALVADCLRAVQTATGARWVAAGKLTKISSLVWIYSARLLDGRTGSLVMDDEYEVKGTAGDMAEIGARVFARRAVARMQAVPPRAASR